MRLLEAHEHARRPRPQHGRPVQGQPRPPRHLQGRPVLGLAGGARPAARRTPARRSRGSASAGRARCAARRRSAPCRRCCACAAARPRSTSTSAAGPPRTATSAPPRCSPPPPASTPSTTTPGELSAAFVWRHSVRVLLSPPPTARYLIGGWSALVDSLEARLRQLGVEVETGAPRRHPAGNAGDRRHRARPGPRAARRRLAPAGRAATPSASTSASSAAAATPSSSPTSTRPAGSSASAPPTPRSPRPARSSCRRRCRSARTRAPRRPGCASIACSTPPCRAGASARPGGGGR